MEEAQESRWKLPERTSRLWGPHCVQTTLLEPGALPAPGAQTWHAQWGRQKVGRAGRHWGVGIGGDGLGGLLRGPLRDQVWGAVLSVDVLELLHLSSGDVGSRPRGCQPLLPSMCPHAPCPTTSRAELRAAPSSPASLGSGRPAGHHSPTFFLTSDMTPMRVSTCCRDRPSRGTPSAKVSAPSAPGSHRCRIKRDT